MSKSNQQLIQQDYGKFLQYIFKAFYDKKLRGMEKDGYARKIVNELQSIAIEKNTKKLMINIPPRFGKTQITTICFVAWCLGRNPRAQFLCVSMTYDLVKVIVSETFKIIKSDEFKEIFPHCELSTHERKSTSFATTKGGYVRGIGAGGSITGKGAGNDDEIFGGCIIIDDIIKPSDIHGIKLQQRNDWYYETAFSRRNITAGKNATPIIIVGQRLHPQDIFGYLTENEGEDEWKKLILPALDENNHPLCNEVMSYEELQNLKRTKPDVYYLQYQQQVNPELDSNQIFKEGWFQFLSTPPKSLFRFGTTDFAITDKTSSDNSVFAVFDIFKINDRFCLYLHDILIGKFSSADMVDEFFKFFNRYYGKNMTKINNVQCIFIEDVAISSIYKDFIYKKQKEQYPHMKYELGSSKRAKSKIDRFLAIQPLFKEFHLFLPAGHQHNREIISELISIRGDMIKKKQKDDIADVISDAFYHTYVHDGFVNKLKNAETLNNFYR